MGEHRSIKLQVAGQQFRVTSTASEGDLERLAMVVDEKVNALTPTGKGKNAQSMLLAAMAFAHEIEEEREKRKSLERQTRDLLRRVLLRIDSVLETDNETTETTPA